MDANYAYESKLNPRLDPRSCIWTPFVPLLEICLGTNLFPRPVGALGRGDHKVVFEIDSCVCDNLCDS